MSQLGWLDFCEFHMVSWYHSTILHISKHFCEVAKELLLPYEVERAFREHVQLLCQALYVCDDDQELLVRFLRDLLTPREARELSTRWRIAQLLLQGKPQVQVAKQLGSSTKTVNMVYQWVYGSYTTGGYAEVYKRLQRVNEDESTNQRR